MQKKYQEQSCNPHHLLSAGLGPASQQIWKKSPSSPPPIAPNLVSYANKYVSIICLPPHFHRSHRPLFFALSATVKPLRLISGSHSPYSKQNDGLKIQA